jgi:prevent-host-death family protein
VKASSVHEAKAQLSRPLDRAHFGEEIVISESGKPYARLIALPGRRPKRESGTLRDFVELGDAFFEPLPPGWTGAT